MALNGCFGVKLKPNKTMKMRKKMTAEKSYQQNLETGN